MDIDELLALPKITGRSPASQAAIADAVELLGVALPSDYRALLLRSNGLDGFVAPESYYLMLDPIEFVATHQYDPNIVPDLVVIGSDGGGEAFGFLPQKGGGVLYVRVPFIGDGLASMDRLATSFAGFIERLRADDFD